LEGVAIPAVALVEAVATPAVAFVFVDVDVSTWPVLADIAADVDDVAIVAVLIVDDDWFGSGDGDIVDDVVALVVVVKHNRVTHKQVVVVLQSC
jgi:hypothetical protein